LRVHIVAVPFTHDLAFSIYYSTANWALGRTTQASTVIYATSNLVDGTTTTFFRSDEVPDSWCRVDLDDVIVVRRIVLYSGASKYNFSLKVNTFD